MLGQPVKTGLDYGFGFRARDKDAGAHLQVEIAEGRVAGDVLERLAFGASDKHGVEVGQLFSRAQTLPHKHGLVDVAQLGVHGFGQQQFGVMFRRLDAGFAQLRGGLTNQVGGNHYTLSSGA